MRLNLSITDLVQAPCILSVLMQFMFVVQSVSKI